MKIKEPRAGDGRFQGAVYDLAAAQRMGVVNRIVPPERLIEEAVAWAEVEPGCHPAYAFTKRALQAATLRAIDDARRLDLDLLASRMTDPGSLRAHARRYRELKGRDPTWEISSQAIEYPSRPIHRQNHKKAPSNVRFGPRADIAN